MPSTGVDSIEAKNRQRYVHLSNLPITANYSEIKEIFEGCQLAEDRILKRGTDAFIVFDDYKSAEDSLPKKDWMINGYYIEYSVIDIWDLRKILLEKSKRILRFNAKSVNQESVHKYLLDKHSKELNNTPIDMSVTNVKDSHTLVYKEGLVSELGKSKIEHRRIKPTAAAKCVTVVGSPSGLSSKPEKETNFQGRIKPTSTNCVTEQGFSCGSKSETEKETNFQGRIKTKSTNCVTDRAFSRGLRSEPENEANFHGGINPWSLNCVTDQGSPTGLSSEQKKGKHWQGKIKPTSTECVTNSESPSGLSSELEMETNFLVKINLASKSCVYDIGSLPGLNLGREQETPLHVRINPTIAKSVKNLGSTSLYVSDEERKLIPTSAECVTKLGPSFLSEAFEIGQESETSNINKTQRSKDSLETKAENGTNFIVERPCSCSNTDEEKLNNKFNNASAIKVGTESTTRNILGLKNVNVLHIAEEAKILNGAAARASGSNSSFSEEDVNDVGQKSAATSCVRNLKKRSSKRRIKPTNVNEEQFKRLPVFHPENCYGAKRIKLGDENVFSQ